MEKRVFFSKKRFSFRERFSYDAQYFLRITEKKEEKK